MVNSGFTHMEKTFGDRLREELAVRGMRPSELARRSGVTKQNIGRLINNTPHSLSGALPRAEPDTVEKLAKALGWDLNEALLAAGYAPRNGNSDPGLFKGIERLTPEKRRIAEIQVRAIIDALSEDDNPDTDYIEEEE